MHTPCDLHARVQRSLLRFAKAAPALLLVPLLGVGCGSNAEDNGGSAGAAATGVGGTAGASSSGGSPSNAAGGGNGPSAGSPGAGNSGASTGGSAGSTGASGSGPGGEGGAAGRSSGGAGTGGGSAGGGAGGGGASAGSGGTGGNNKSAGCGTARMLQDGTHMLQSGGAQRRYALRAPTAYDNTHPYRLMLGFHGAGGKSSDIAPSYFGLWDLAENSTIFAAPDAVDGLWKADSDTQMVSDLVKELEAQLCIDTSRVELEGFSQGGAMVWTLACALPDTFRLAIVHSGGGLPMPQSCKPIPFLSSLGHDGSGQGMSSDYFAKTNGCKVETLPTAPTGSHACTNYMGCSADHPTRFCAYDGGHTPAPTDSGQGKSWMPQEVWTFVKQF